MTFHLQTETTVAAPPEKVWSVLMDFAAYPEWNTFITSLTHEGNLTVGSRLAAVISPPGGNTMTFKPTVTVLDEGRVLEWEGNLFFSFLFCGRHRFELVPTDDGGTRFVHSEKFSGLLLPLIKGDMDTKTREGFENMNKDLKARSEK